MPARLFMSGFSAANGADLAGPFLQEFGGTRKTRTKVLQSPLMDKI
jgi:hypothetical protein